MPPEQVNELRYELATAYNGDGQREKALENLNSIYKADPAFKDVKEKIELISATKEEGKKEKETQKKSKISYV
jgi:thioredoxin-like negative regulator of GroEL